MRDPNDILNLFRRIEKTVDVSKLTYRGINMWPAFRLQLGFDVLYDRNPAPMYRVPQPAWWKGIIEVPYFLLRIPTLYFRFLASLPRQLNPNWIFAFNDVVFVDKVDGKKYSRYFDPYYEFLRDNALEPQRVTFRTLDEVGCTGPDYFHQSTELQIHILQKIYFCLQKLRYHFGFYRKDVRRAKSIVSQVSRGVNPQEKKFLSLRFYNLFEEITAYRFCFSLLFRHLKPENILFECFYTEMKMGMIAAAGNKVRTIEIQHGVVEDFMYIPYAGNMGEQNLIPHYLWCWSKNDTKTIRSFNGNSERLKPLRMGNLWFARNEIAGKKQLPEKYVSISSESAKIILITLQHQIGYQTVFHDVVRLMPSDWLVLLRFHPLMTETEKEEYIRVFQNFPNVDMECNSVLSLFQCFSLADVHITHSSTAAIEAISFGKLSVLVDQIGYAYFKDSVDAGVLLFSDKPADIVRIIKEKKEMNTEITESYLIGVDQGVLSKDLKDLLVV